MIKETIQYMLDVAKKHKLINQVGYLKSTNINDQHNNKYYQFIIENETRIDNESNEGILSYYIDFQILGFIGRDETIIDVQDSSLHICIDFINYIDNSSYPIEVKDYSIISFEDYTDDRCSGVRCSMRVAIPNIINLCNYKDNFIDKEDEIEDIFEMTPNIECEENTYTNETKIKLNPISLL